MTVATRIAGAAALGAIMLTGLGLAVPPAKAAYIVTLEQVGANVVATGSGTIDLTDLMFAGSVLVSPQVGPFAAVITTGASGRADLYSGFTGPARFGSGGLTDPDSGSGDPVGINSAFDYRIVPHDYVFTVDIAVPEPSRVALLFLPLGVALLLGARRHLNRRQNR
jgi:hypothetical protein